MLRSDGAGSGSAARGAPGRRSGTGRMAPEHIAGGYALLALLWLLVLHGERRATTHGTVEDVVFVAVTATVLWAVLHRRDRAIVARERQLAAERSRIEAMSEDYGHGTIILQGATITFASSSVGAMAGRDSAELVGRELGTLLDPGGIAAIEEILAEPRSPGSPDAGGAPGSPRGTGATVTGRVRSADGAERWVRGVISDHRGNPDVHGVVINLHDIDDLQRREHLITSLLRGATNIAAASSEQAVCEAFLAACIDATGLRLGAVRLRHGDALVVAVSHDDEQLQPRQARLSVDGTSLGATVVRTGQAVVLETPDEVDALPAGSVPDGVRAACYVPMSTPKSCVGYLGLAATTAHRFDGPTRVALATFAQQAALALERVRLERARGQAVAAVTAAARRGEAVHRLTEAFSRAVRVEDVLDAAVGAIVDALRPDTAAAVEVGDGGIRRVAQRGPVTLEAAGPRYDAYAALAQDVFRTSQPHWFSTPGELDRAAGHVTDDPAADRGPWSSGCCVPMRLDDEVVGVLIIGWAEARRLHGRERRLIEMIATLCAEAVRRARLHDSAEDAARRHRDLSARYESLFRHHPHPMFVYDLESFELLAVNDALVAAFRYDDPAELIGRDGSELLDPPGRRPPLGGPADAERLTGPQPLRMRRKDGSWFIAECAAHVAGGFAGHRARVVACIDQTARIEAQEDRRRLEHRVVDVAERERRAVAEDLHDGPVQSLAAAAMWLSALRRGNERGEPIDGGRLAAVEQIVIDTIDGLRTTMMRLYPPTFDQLSLAEAIRDAVTESPLLSELDVDVEDNLRGQLDGPVKAALYRVVLEALTNVRKHAGVRRSTVHLDELDDAIDVRIVDHGIGVARTGADDLGCGDLRPGASATIDDGPLRRAAHLGLSSMRDRVAMVGGDCLVEALEGGAGTVVRARIPIGAVSGGSTVVDTMSAD